MTLLPLPKKCPIEKITVSATQINKNKKSKNLRLTSLSFMANIIALACSAALPTIGSKITLINATGKFHATDAPYKLIIQPQSSLIITATRQSFQTFTILPSH